MGASLERSFAPVAAQKGLALTIARAASCPDAVTTDRQLLEQILKNLISNALKFTERGSIDVRFGLAPAGTTFARASLAGAAAVLAISVRDTGTGVPADKREIIFEAFQQADASAARKYGGTGLGLTISREYARVLGGEIVLESTEGAGSTFTLHLPVDEADLAAGAPPHDEARRPRPPAALAPVTPAPEDEIPHAPLSGRTILVVDDDARNLYTVTGLLERYGARVLAASSARDAFELVRAHPDVALVLMDVMMPDVDGLAAARDLRGEHPDLPIVALTAKASARDREACLAAGMVDYVSKPADARQLVDVIARHARTVDATTDA